MASFYSTRLLLSTQTFSQCIQCGIDRCGKRFDATHMTNDQGFIHRCSRTNMQGFTVENGYIFVALGIVATKGVHRLGEYDIPVHILISRIAVYANMFLVA